MTDHLAIHCTFLLITEEYIRKNDNYYEYIKDLLVKGANPNSFSVGYNTPLQNAPNIEIFKLLISFGGDITIKKHELLSFHVMRGNIDIVTWLFKNGYDITMWNGGRVAGPDIWTFLINNSFDIVKHKYPNGFCATRQNERGMQPIYMWKLLIDNGFPVNEKDLNGETAIFSAYTIDEVNALVGANANIHVFNKHGYSPCACFRGRERDIIPTFVELGHHDWRKVITSSLSDNIEMEWKRLDRIACNLLILVSTYWRVGKESKIRRLPVEMFKFTRTFLFKKSLIF